VTFKSGNTAKICNQTYKSPINSHYNSAFLYSSNPITECLFYHFLECSSFIT